jgi:hypothetical protein
MSTLVVTIVPATTAYEQQPMIYTNSDPGYVIWEVKA